MSMTIKYKKLQSCTHLSAVIREIQVPKSSGFTFFRSVAVPYSSSFPFSCPPKILPSSDFPFSERPSFTVESASRRCNIAAAACTPALAAVRRAVVEVSGSRSTPARTSTMALSSTMREASISVSMPTSCAVSALICASDQNSFVTPKSQYKTRFLGPPWRPVSKNNSDKVNNKLNNECTNKL